MISNAVIRAANPSPLHDWLVTITSKAGGYCLCLKGKEIIHIPTMTNPGNNAGQLNWEHAAHLLFFFIFEQTTRAHISPCVHVKWSCFGLGRQHPSTTRSLSQTRIWIWNGFAQQLDTGRLVPARTGKDLEQWVSDVSVEFTL